MLVLTALGHPVSSKARGTEIKDCALTVPFGADGRGGMAGQEPGVAIPHPPEDENNAVVTYGEAKTYSTGASGGPRCVCGAYVLAACVACCMPDRPVLWHTPAVRGGVKNFPKKKWDASLHLTCSLRV